MKTRRSFVGGFFGVGQQTDPKQVFIGTPIKTYFSLCALAAWHRMGAAAGSVLDWRQFDRRAPASSGS
jgi:hypothetical protein